MTTEEAMLEEIAELSRRIDASTDALNETILNLNDRIAATKASATAWVSMGLLSTGIWQLGWSRVGEKWTLSAKKEGADAIALTGAPREVRFASVSFFDALLKELASSLRAMLGKIGEVKSR